MFCQKSGLSWWWREAILFLRDVFLWFPSGLRDTTYFRRGVRNCIIFLWTKLNFVYLRWYNDSPLNANSYHPVACYANGGCHFLLAQSVAKFVTWTLQGHFISSCLVKFEELVSFVRWVPGLPNALRRLQEIRIFSRHSGFNAHFNKTCTNLKYLKICNIFRELAWFL